MQLIFVYNADSGLFNTVADIGKKIFAPERYSCQLCALTHGYFTMHGPWKAFIESLSVDCEFLHRDEFVDRYGMPEVALPAVFVNKDENLSTCIEATQLNRCENLDELKALIERRCT